MRRTVRAPGSRRLVRPSGSRYHCPGRARVDAMNPAVLSTPRLSARGLQRSEHRLVLLAGDCVAAIAAALLALWAWSMTTGFQFDARFVGRWAGLLLLAPLWVAIIGQSRRMPRSLSIEATAQSLVIAAMTLLTLYFVVYFYAPLG